jgi:ATP-dependent RNA helicase DDX56/DBP9
MKRKLNEDDVPTPVANSTTLSHSSVAFESLQLDPRLLQAVAKEGFSKPTDIQAQTIPQALEGKDILGKQVIDDFISANSHSPF